MPALHTQDHNANSDSGSKVKNGERVATVTKHMAELVMKHLDECQASAAAAAAASIAEDGEWHDVVSFRRENVLEAVEKARKLVDERFEKVSFS